MALAKGVERQGDSVSKIHVWRGTPLPDVAKIRFATDL
jgi:hypothetical protein